MRKRITKTWRFLTAEIDVEVRHKDTNAKGGILGRNGVPWSSTFVPTREESDS